MDKTERACGDIQHTVRRAMQRKKIETKKTPMPVGCNMKFNPAENQTAHNNIKKSMNEVEMKIIAIRTIKITRTYNINQ